MLDVVGVPVGVLTQLVLVPVVYIPLRALWPGTFTDQRLEETARDLVDRADGASLVLLFVVIAVGAPIVEELVYRGMLQGAFVARVNELLGSWLRAPWFALIHFRPVEYPGLFVAGLVFGTCFLATGRLGTAIAAHAAFNATGLLRCGGLRPPSTLRDVRAAGVASPARDPPDCASSRHADPSPPSQPTPLFRCRRTLDALDVHSSTDVEPLPIQTASPTGRREPEPNPTPDRAPPTGDTALDDPPDVLTPRRTTPVPIDDAVLGRRERPAAAVRRIVRRPSCGPPPWPTDRIVKLVVTVLSLGITTAVMMNVVHLNPLSPARDLVFDDTTPTGGDFGAHVWGPAFLRDHLLTSGG